MAYIEDEENLSAPGLGEYSPGGMMSGGGQVRTGRQMLPSGMFTDTAKYLKANTGTDIASTVGSNLGQRSVDLAGRIAGTAGSYIGDADQRLRDIGTASGYLGGWMPALQSGVYSPGRLADESRFVRGQTKDLDLPPTIDWGGLGGEATNLVNLYDRFKSGDTGVQSGALADLYPRATKGERDLDSLLLGGYAPSQDVISGLNTFDPSVFGSYDRDYSGRVGEGERALGALRNEIGIFEGTQNPFAAERTVDPADLNYQSVTIGNPESPVLGLGPGQKTVNMNDIFNQYQDALKKATGRDFDLSNKSADIAGFFDWLTRANRAGVGDVELLTVGGLSEPYQTIGAWDPSKFTRAQRGDIINWFSKNWGEFLDQIAGRNDPYTIAADPRRAVLESLITGGQMPGYSPSYGGPRTMGGAYA